MHSEDCKIEEIYYFSAKNWSDKVFGNATASDGSRNV